MFSDKEKSIISKFREFDLVDDFHQLVHHPHAAGLLSASGRGFIWEERVAEECARRGFEFRKAEKAKLPYDCYINGYRVQSKASRRDPTVFDLRGHKLFVTARGGTDRRAYLDKDLDAMALKNLFTNEVFIVPVSAILDDKNPGYIKSYIRWADYRGFADNWSIFDTGVGMDAPVPIKQSPSIDAGDVFEFC